MSNDDLLRVVPPHSTDAERSVLGSMLQDGKATVVAFGELVKEDFYMAEHKEIYDAMQAMYRDKQPIDLMTVSNTLQRRGTLDGVGGSAYLLSACRYVPTTANVTAYIRIVAEKSKLRRLIAQCRQTEEQCYMQQEEIDVITENLRSGLRGLEHGDAGLLTMADVMSQTIDYLEKRAKGQLVGLKTGISTFDKITGGLMGGELCVIGARPGVGKSVYGMLAGLIASQTSNVMFDSFEMPPVQLGLRMMANKTGIPMTDLRLAENIGDMQWESIGDAANALAARKMRMDFTFPTVERIRAKAHQMKDEHGLDLLIVDYMQLIKTAAKSDNRVLEVGAISRTLKEIALTLSIPVIAMAQVNRNAANKCPSLSELRESGSIEQDADLVLFLHEPEDPSDPDMPSGDKQHFLRITDAGRRYLLNVIAKQRNGVRAVFGTDFDPSLMTINCLSYDR